MKKRNNIFNKNLFKEGLRQSALFGIFLIVSSIILNCMETFEKFALSSFSTTIYVEYYPKDINTSMNYLSILIPFAMAYCQFRFLNSRKGCDFYHALPIKRSTLVINFSLASMVYIIVAMVVPILANTLLNDIPQYNIVDYTSLLPCILDYVLVSLLSFSAILIGISLTRNPIPAGIVALIIMILPRYAITSAVITSNDTSNLFLRGELLLGDIFGNKYNLFYKKFTDFFDHMKKDNVVYPGTTNETIIPRELDYEMFSYIYTGGLVLVLFTLACYIFIKRKSEIATSVTSAKLSNNIVKIILVSPCVVLLISNIFVYKSKSVIGYFGSMNAGNVLIYPLIIAIILIFFIYELIATKSVTQMLKSAPVFLIVIVLSAGYYGIIETTISLGMKNSKIDTNDITSVSFDFMPIYDLNLFDTYDPYTLQLIKDYEFTDPRIIELVSSCINKSVQYNNNPYIYDGITAVLGNTTINTKSMSIKRNFGFPKDELSEIVSIIKSDEYINNVLLPILPSREDVHIARATSFGTNFDTEKTNLVTETLYKEFDSLTNAQKIDSIYRKDVLRYDLYRDEINGVYSDPNFAEYSSIEALTTEFRYKYYGIGAYKESILYEFDEEQNTTIYKNFPSYNSNDYYPYIALYTIEGHGKYIELNENFPNTKKLLVDLYLKENKSQFNEFESYTNSGISYFGISALEDSYLSSSGPLYYPHNVVNPDYATYDDELINLIKAAILRLDGDIDYDNIYIFNFYNKSSSSNSKSSYIKLLLPLTQQEYEKYLLNIADYVTITSRGTQIPLSHIGQPVSSVS